MQHIYLWHLEKKYKIEHLCTDEYEVYKRYKISQHHTANNTISTLKLINLTMYVKLKWYNSTVILLKGISFNACLDLFMSDLFNTIST